MYADYTFYLNNYRGRLGNEDFSRLRVPAEAHINRITSNRATSAAGTELEAVKMAVCSVVDELDNQQRGGIVTFESNDGISKSYAAGTVVKSYEERIYFAAETFLGSTGLLFVGV